MMDQYNYTSVLTDHVYVLRMMASTSRTIQGVIQLAVYMHSLKRTRMSLPFSSG